MLPKEYVSAARPIVFGDSVAKTHTTSNHTTRCRPTAAVLFPSPSITKLPQTFAPAVAVGTDDGCDAHSQQDDDGEAQLDALYAYASYQKDPRAMYRLAILIEKSKLTTLVNQRLMQWPSLVHSFRKVHLSFLNNPGK